MAADHYGEGWKLCTWGLWTDDRTRDAWHHPHWLRPGESCYAGRQPRQKVSWGSWECTGCGAVYRVRRKKPAPCKQWWWVHPEGAPSYTEHCGGDWRRVDEDAYGPLPAADPEAEPEEPTMAEREAAGQEVLL